MRWRKFVLAGLILFLGLSLKVDWNKVWAYSPFADQIQTITDNFDNRLSGSDSDVQKALDTLDDYTLGSSDINWTDVDSLEIQSAGINWTSTDDLEGNGELGTDVVSDNEMDYGNVTLDDFTFDVNDVSKTEFGYLDGVASAIQTQMDNRLKLDGSNANSNIDIGDYNLATTGTLKNPSGTLKLQADDQQDISLWEDAPDLSGAEDGPKLWFYANGELASPPFFQVDKYGRFVIKNPADDIALLTDSGKIWIEGFNWENGNEMHTYSVDMNLVADYRDAGGTFYFKTGGHPTSPGQTDILDLNEETADFKEADIKTTGTLSLDGGTTTINSTEINHIDGLDQDLATTDSPTFNTATLSYLKTDEWLDSSGNSAAHVEGSQLIIDKTYLISNIYFPTGSAYLAGDGTGDDDNINMTGDAFFNSGGGDLGTSTYYWDKSYITSSDPEIIVLSPITDQRAADLLAYIPDENKGATLYFEKNTEQLRAVIGNDIYEVQMNKVGTLPSTDKKPTKETKYKFDKYSGEVTEVQKINKEGKYQLQENVKFDTDTGKFLKYNKEISKTNAIKQLKEK